MGFHRENNKIIEREDDVEILLIRHGESEADLLKVHEGRADFPLTEKGLDQAKKMAKFVSLHFPPEIILASPLKRAKRTAEILREEIGCRLIIEPDLMEYNNGVLAGLSKDEGAKNIRCQREAVQFIYQFRMENPSLNFVFGLKKCTIKS